MNRRVVITGIGLVTPLGVGQEDNWKGLLEGRSGIAPITLFDASSFPTKIAAEVKDEHFNFAGFVDDVSPYERSGRNTKFAIAAAKMAYEDSHLEDADVEPQRLGVYLGSGEGSLDFFQFVLSIAEAWGDGSVDTTIFVSEGMARLDAIRELEQEPNMPSTHLAEIFNAQGINSNCLTACAASSQAIGEATEIIRRGDADIMISGGTHSMIHPFGIAGFNLLTALSTRNEEPTKASRPFDRDRDGFIVGEGACTLILEELSHARSRGAHIYAEIIGYGSTADAFRITDTHPEGRGAMVAMQLALKDAGVSPENIDYINAHGTSTIVNDKIETMAIKKVFGDYAYEVPISSIKSMLGHLIAAAGATEIATCCFAMRDKMVPPTINYENPDPNCDLDYVPNEPREVDVNTVLSNSFGFGGQNISLVVKKFTG